MVSLEEVVGAGALVSGGAITAISLINKDQIGLLPIGVVLIITGGAITKKRSKTK